MPEHTVWRFARADLQRTPSVESGWTVEQEELDRAKACGLIYSAGRRLQVPQNTAATACVFLQRFFMRHTLQEFHHYDVAATCLFVACKAEESVRRLEAFVPVIAHCASKGRRRAAVGSAEYTKWRAVILRTEVAVLQALCFDVVVDQPHARLAEVAAAEGLCRRAAQLAWGFVGDCLRLPLAVVFPARVVACAAIVVAARVAGGEPRDGWLERAGVARTDVAEAVQWLLEFYVREAHARMGGGASGSTGSEQGGAGSEQGGAPAEHGAAVGELPAAA
ncbi:hypothetical protein H4R20_004206 [Coemansia guatemalensis]|uniref:Cyclin-like domain-containing protein n=1 Tax=Coemansia guatemalensis TaxID=2761395 RepID=A0A9W8LTC1_9FUNG|nr:hypothetical protein H4R20_004206 [Coemansia guatemalensis]